MNMSDQHFFDLSVKVISGQASQADQSELASHLANDARLNAEFERLQCEVRLAKELLPLLAAAEASQRELPGYGRVRLQAAVRRTFGRSRGAADAPRPQAFRRWLLGLSTVAAVGVTIISWFESRRLQNAEVARASERGNTDRIVQSKPIIQLAMLDSLGPTRGGKLTTGAAAAGLTTGGTVVATLGEILAQATKTFSPTPSSIRGAVTRQSWGQTNVAVFSETTELKRWLEDWPTDKQQPAFKVWFDRDAAEVRVLGCWDGKVRRGPNFPVAKEADLPSVFEGVRTLIEKAMTNRMEIAKP